MAHLLLLICVCLLTFCTRSEESCRADGPEEAVMLQVRAPRPEDETRRPENFDEVVAGFEEFFNLSSPTEETRDFFIHLYMADRRHNEDFMRQNGQTKALPGRLMGSNAGRCSSLFTLGSPGSGSPGLRPFNGGCYPGTRISSFTDTIVGKRTDPVAWIAQGLWFYHPLMDTLQLHENTPSRDVFTACSEDFTRQPPWEYLPGSHWSLHSGTTYKPAMEASEQVKDSDLMTTVFDVSYEKQCPQCAQDRLQVLGWNVVGAARFPGSLTEGEQVSYLLQNSTSLDCIHTFQGSDSGQDFWTDAAAYAVPFCGLTEEGDNCCSNPTGICPGKCAPTGNGISFVHLGFRNQLTRMVSTESWQKNVRGKLPFCKSVTAFGHSLGGAMSELFAACLEQSLQDGDFGYEDFSRLSWTKSTPTRLPPSPDFTV